MLSISTIPALIAVAGFCLLLCATEAAGAAESAPLAVGDKAPGFTAMAEDGSAFTFAAFQKAHPKTSIVLATSRASW